MLMRARLYSIGTVAFATVFLVALVYLPSRAAPPAPHADVPHPILKESGAALRAPIEPPTSQTSAIDVVMGVATGACCDPVALQCNEVAPADCTGAYLGDGVPCAQCSLDSPLVGAPCTTCAGGSNQGALCTGAADCPGGSCVLNDGLCRLCDDFTTPCTNDIDCTGIGSNLCSLGTCEYNAACTVGACCIAATGECLEGHTAPTCSALGGLFEGLGTDCDPDCCEQPAPLPGSDNCETAAVSLMEIPPGRVCMLGDRKGLPCTSPADCNGAACERAVVKTVTGNNAPATNTISDPDSCFAPEGVPGSELGWFEAIQIYDPLLRADDTIPCGYLVLDHCCTGPVRTSANRVIYNSCPCGGAIAATVNPIHPERPAYGNGAPICLQDNAWHQFGPLMGAGDAADVAAGVGTYYYAVKSTIGGDLGPYQMHIRVEACPDAVCCVGEDCRLLNLLECQAAGGFFLAPPNKSVPVTVCAGACQTGSCCTGLGECEDNEDPSHNSQIDMTKLTCDALGGAYVGGVRCFGGTCAGGSRQDQSCQMDVDCPGGGVCVGDPIDLAQPSPCPICDLQGPDGGITCDAPGASRSGDTPTVGLTAAPPCAGENHLTDTFIDTVFMGGPMVAISWTPPISAPLTITGIEIFTGEDPGPIEFAIWSDAAGLPGTNLGNTLAAPIGLTNAWQGADFVTPVTILPATPYWVVFDPSGGEQAPVQSVTTGQTYWGSYIGGVTGGASWFGPFSFPDRGWKFRMLCCQPLPDGSGCTDSGCGCFGECVGGGYCDNPNCCLSGGAPPDCAICYAKNSQESIKLCGDCFGECIGGGYCDGPDPSCCLEPGNCQCYVPSHHYSIYLCGDCFGECIGGSYCDPPNPDCCIAGPGNCQCYAPTDPISIKMCGNQESCRPSCVNYDPQTQISLVTDCDCGSANECHVTIPQPGAGPPTCVDGCPPDKVCEQTETQNPDGTVDICCSCVPACVPAPAGMLAWWPMDEQTGSAAFDAAGSNDAVYVGSPTPVPSGKVDGSLDCTSGYAEAAGGPFNIGASDFTIDAWVKLPATATSGEFWVVDRDHDFHFAATANPFSAIHLEYTCGIAFWPTGLVPLDTWFHIAVTVTPSQTAGLKMYFNGSLVGTANTCAYNVNYTVPLRLGRGSARGELDEVEFFNRVLSDTEIMQLYQADSAGKCKCEPLPDESGCTNYQCGCFGECIGGSYCDDPNCCLDGGEPPNCAVCYAKNSQESIKLCGDCFGECIGGGYCDSILPGCSLEGAPVCWLPNNHYSIYLCGDCFGQCINGSYCDHPNPDCCLAGPNNCQCYAPSDPISIKMCGKQESCRPTCVNYNPATGTTLVNDCDCGTAGACHATIPPPGAGPPTCDDDCPFGVTCVPIETVNADGTIDICCQCVPPPVQHATGSVGNRYLTFDMAPGVPGSPCVTCGLEAIRVKFVSLDGYAVPNPDYLWVGNPFDAPEEDQTNPGLTFKAAPLSCDPVFRDWSTVGVLSVFGAEIMPNSEYEVQRVHVGCADLSDPACYSAAVTIRTAKYGDVWPLFEAPGNPPQPDFNDIAAMVQKFLASGPALAPVKAACQLQPNVVFPMRPIDFRDIAADVQAFLGVTYASVNSGPCACPPAVTCGATSCVSDLDCRGFGDGLCVDGFCADACGRCTP